MTLDFGQYLKKSYSFRSSTFNQKGYHPMSTNTEVIKYLDTNFNKQVKLNNINLLKKYETLI